MFVAPNNFKSSVLKQLEHLCCLFQQGTVEGGQRGELVARFLLIQSLRIAGLDDGVQKNFCTARQLLSGLGVDLTANSDFDLLDKKVHLSHWMQATGNISAQTMAQVFSGDVGLYANTTSQI
jgi:hypothetical protein